MLKGVARSRDGDPEDSEADSETLEKEEMKKTPSILEGMILMEETGLLIFALLVEGFFGHTRPVLFNLYFLMH